MKNTDIIARAVQIAVSRLDRSNIRPGRVLAHPAHAIAFECESITDGTVYGDDARGKVSFPLAEVFDPNECRDIALQIQADHVASRN